VVWLRRRLTLVAGSKWDSRMGPESPFFDDTLEARVRNFQLMHGLKPERIAGPRPQISLNALAPEASIATLAVEADESQEEPARRRGTIDRSEQAENRVRARSYRCVRGHVGAGLPARYHR